MLLLNPVEPSVPQVPLWHGFIAGKCLFKRTLVCPGELLQAGSAIYCLPRCQGPIFVAGGRPQNGLGWLGWLAGLAGLGGQRGRLQRAEIFRAPRPRPAGCGAAAKK